VGRGSDLDRLEDAGVVVLSAEHDSFAWLPLEEAAALCVPAHVGDQLRAVAVRRG
jgi:hypothetical protein